MDVWWTRWWPPKTKKDPGKAAAYLKITRWQLKKKHLFREAETGRPAQRALTIRPWPLKKMSEDVAFLSDALSTFVITWCSNDAISIHFWCSNERRFGTKYRAHYLIFQPSLLRDTFSTNGALENLPLNELVMEISGVFHLIDPPRRFVANCTNCNELKVSGLYEPTNLAF